MQVVDKEGNITKTYPVSTAKLGVGNEINSYRTPLGRLRIVEKIGEGAPLGTVFKGRKPVSDIPVQEALANKEEDFILTRILRLEGLESCNSNTYERYIYIHGTNQESQIGQPASRGCIRMRNADIIELFELLPDGVDVEILP